MDEKLIIEALGSVRVSLGRQEPLPLNAQKAGALLVYLAYSGGQHARESLAEMFWPERSPERALASLRMALAALRQHLADYLVVSRQSIGLAPGSYRMDACDLIETVAEAQRARGHLSSTTLRHLDEALGGYRGDLLRDFYDGSPEFEDWLYLTREQVKSAFCEGTLILANERARSGSYAEALSLIRSALRFDPLHEALNRQLMLCLLHSGQPGEAEAHFHNFRQRLGEEFDLEPSVEMIRLCRIVQADQSSEARTSFALNAPQDPPMHATPLMGREDLLVELAALLANPERRLLTLVGPGGIGKTRLAQACADLHQHTTAFPDGVYFVPLAAYASASQIAPAIAAALDYRPAADGRPLEQQIVDVMRRKQALIVLDNYEHLLEGAQIAAGLASATSVHVLVTSREPLHAPGEHVLPVDGLAYPQTGSPPPDYEAGRLFVRAVQRLFPAYAPSVDDAAAIAQICRAVGGSPLGILLAAAWIDVLTPAEIAAEIQRNLHILENKLPGAPDRHSSIRAVFEATWQRLSVDLRQVFMHLAVFRGGFTREATQAVAGVSLRDLQTLAGKSLLARDPDGRMTMHELLRQYALEQLLQAGDEVTAHDAHSRYYLAFLQAREADIKGGRQGEALKEIDADFENVRAAWTWSVERGAIAALGDAIECLHWYATMRWREPEVYALLHRALDAMVRPEDEAVRGHLLAYCWRTPAEGRIRLREALSIARRQHDDAALARCLFQRGMIARVATHDKASCKLLECAYHAYAQRGDTFALGAVGTMWTTALIYSGRAAEAEQISASLLPRLRMSGERINRAYLLYNYASSLATRGADDDAEQCHQEAREILIEAGDHLTAANIGAWGMGIAALRKAQYSRARKLALELLPLAQEYQNTVSQARALCMLSAVDMAEGDAASAYDLAQQASVIFGDHANATYADSFLATMSAAQGDYRTARAICERWLTLAVTVGECVLTSLLLIPAAIVLAHEGKHESAITCAAMALHHPANLGAWAERMLAQHDLPACLKLSVPAYVYERAWQAGLTTNPQVILDEFPEPGSTTQPPRAPPIAKRARVPNGSDRHTATKDTSR
ncbi:MAG: AAA family ATPase [Anaerolineae bacterium]|nr:AAA family ATPase [Anaerolineae bacterium]